MVFGVCSYKMVAWIIAMNLGLSLPIGTNPKLIWGSIG